MGAQPSYFLPYNHTASSSHPSSRGRSRAKGPKAWHPHCQLLVAFLEGQKTFHTLTLVRTGLVPVPCITSAWHQQPHRMDGTQTLQPLLGAPPAFWDARPGWEHSARLGAVPAQPGCLHSHPSAQQHRAAAMLLQDSAVQSWVKAVLPASHTSSALTPPGKGGDNPGVPLGSLPGCQGRTWGCSRSLELLQKSRRWVYSQRRGEEGNTGGVFPLSLSRAPGHKLSPGWGLPRCNSALPPSVASRGNATV